MVTASPATSSTRKHHKQDSPEITTPIFNSLLKTIRKRNKINSNIIATRSKPHFDIAIQKVTLLDWWLVKVKVEGSPNAFKLGVGGNACDGRASMHFCSREIVKRHDEITLETVDGIKVTLTGLLNRFYTLENGFPSQVCDHFFLGFPFDWEGFSAHYFGEESIHGARSSKDTRMSLDDIDDPKCFLSSFDNIPVTRLFDHMMVSSGDYNECPLTRSVFDHILSEYGSSCAELDEEDTNQVITEDSLPFETGKSVVAKRCSLDKALRDRVEDKNDDVILVALPMGTIGDFPTIHSKSTMDEDVHNLSKDVFTGCRSGYLTRSKARLKKPRTDPENNTAEADVTAVHHGVQPTKISDPCPTSEANKSKKDASSRHVPVKLSKENDRVIDTSAVRRSGRTRNVKQ